MCKICIQAERLQRETGEVELEEEEEEEEDDSFVSETFLSQLTFESPEEPKELERQRQRQAKKAQEFRIAKEEDAFASRRHRKRIHLFEKNAKRECFDGIIHKNTAQMNIFFFSNFVFSTICYFILFRS